MRVVQKPGLLIVLPDTEAETDTFQTWAASHQDHVFHLAADANGSAVLRHLGLRSDACREPINIVFETSDDRFRPISNLALTPFDLDGRRYASVEGFWQGLKLESAAERERIAALSGTAAKNAGPRVWPPTFDYDGRTYPSGAHPHWTLMRRACQAKFSQNAEARAALLATGVRPLTHKVRRDSRTIPGALMADIWMRIRAKLIDKAPLT
jgi:predicted NAD-dependent protein-ADP-ribosyltransferase YbiA (DUF1768 family)